MKKFSRCWHVDSERDQAKSTFNNSSGLEIKTARKIICNTLDALEGLRSQGYPNEEVTVRRYEIMQRFIEGVRNFELKRNLALMYAPEQ